MLCTNVYELMIKLQTQKEKLKQVSLAKQLGKNCLFTDSFENKCM